MENLQDNIELYGLIQKLLANTNEYTNNPILNEFCINECTLIDQNSETDNFIKEKKQKIYKFIRKIDVCEKYEQIKSAYEEYIEAVIYLKLKEKLNIQRVEEMSNKKTPDFKVGYEGEEFYVEVKALSCANPIQNIKECINDSLNVKISLEKQLNQGKRVASEISVYRPFCKNEKKYDSYSVKNATEIIIEKINNNIKAGQLDFGDTILIVDISQFVIPTQLTNSILPEYIDYMHNTSISGMLWNAAFGKIDREIFKPIEFEGLSNSDGTLEKNGILVDNKINCLCFSYKEIGQNSTRKILGLYNDTKYEKVIKKISDYYNNDKNENVDNLKGEQNAV